MADADTEEPQFTTLAERIAALNKQKNFSAPENKARKPPPPPPSAKPEPRSQTFPIAAPTETASETPANHPTPSIPARPTRNAAPRATPPPLPRRTTEASQSDTQPAAPGSRPPPPPPPQLPTRSATSNLSPSLPARRPTNQQLEVRRGSNASEISTLSSQSFGHGTVSSATSVHSIDGSTRKLPPTLDQANLPPLPPSKRERDAQAKEAANRHREVPAVKPPPSLPSVKSTPAIRQVEPPTRPNLPPRLTNTSVNQPAQRPTPEPEPAPQPPKPARRLPPVVAPPVIRQPTTNGLHHQEAQPREEPPQRPAGRPPPIPGRVQSSLQPRTQPQPQSQPQLQDEEDVPPPVPLSSRPTFAQIEAASHPNPSDVNPPTNDCLTCRDFSRPDGVAAQYPRQSLPRDDPVGYLAQMLCSPFTSYTDKARAIFTWFFHNIAYDCAAFFGNSVRARGAEETISMGRAVCSGYADTYKAIAERAGMECVVVSGHGKGFGHTALKKGERPPPKKVDGHAWNAVRIDGGEWKLLDSCWGAGNVSHVTKTFTPHFKPDEFTKRNEIFGLSHFPKDEGYFFRDDGRRPTWEEYYIGPVHGETPTVYTNAHQEGIAPLSIEPREAGIPVTVQGQGYNPYVRFQFSKICEHWTSEKHGLGKPPLLLLSMAGRGGKKEMVPMETDGFWWWVDVNAADLGPPGESVSVVMLSKLDGRDARGVSGKEFLAKRGKVGMSWAGIIKWDLI